MLIENSALPAPNVNKLISLKYSINFLRVLTFHLRREGTHSLGSEARQLPIMTRGKKRGESEPDFQIREKTCLHQDRACVLSV